MSSTNDNQATAVKTLQRLPASLVKARDEFQAQHDESAPVAEDFECELVVSDGVATLRLMESAPGSPGVQGYAPGGGVANNFDQKRTYHPYSARGLNRNFGLYHQTYLDSAAYQRGLAKIYEGLSTGYWSVEPVVCQDEATQELADLQALCVQAILFGIQGGWSKHVQEVLYALVAGFAPFIRVTDGFGQLKALSFRYPSQVHRWFTNQSQSELLGVEFYNAAQDGSGTTYKIAASDLLLYQFNAVGNNWEGISPLRGVLKYAKMYELFLQIEACAAEKYGCPVTFVERPPGQYDKADDDRVVAILDAFVATDNAVLLLPGGYKVTVASPQGQVPDFEPIKRYLNEQISMALTAEGALVGMNGVGSYNMAEIKDAQALRTLVFYAKFVTDVINGTNLPYTGIIEHIVANLPDDLLRQRINGELPKLRWSLSAEQDATSVEQITAAKTAGMITWNAGDEAWLRERLKLPSIVEDEESAAAAPPVAPAPNVEVVDEVPAPVAPAPAEVPADAAAENPEAAAIVESGGKVADAALNGAQISSAIAIIKSVKMGEIDLRSGIELLKMAFLIDEDRAMALLNSSTSPAPGAESSTPVGGA